MRPQRNGRIVYSWVRCSSTTWSSSAQVRAARRPPSPRPSWANRWRSSNAADARRRLRQHRHHPVEDAARGGALPDRHESARALRRQLPGQGQDHPGRPVGANPARDRQAGRCGAQSVDAQPSRSASSGDGRFVDAHTICSSKTAPAASAPRSAASTSSSPPAPSRPAPTGVEFDEQRVLDSDGILDLKSIPTSMVVVGAGVIGVEYASMFAALGTKVTIVEKRQDMLDFCDPEIIEALAVPPARPGGHVPLRRRGDRASTSARRAPSPLWPAARRSPPRR